MSTLETATRWDSARRVRRYAAWRKLRADALAALPGGALERAVQRTVDDAAAQIIEGAYLDAVELWPARTLTLTEYAEDFIRNERTLLVEQRGVELPWRRVRVLRRRFVHGYRRGVKR